MVRYNPNHIYEAEEFYREDHYKRSFGIVLEIMVMENEQPLMAKVLWHQRGSPDWEYISDLVLMENK